MSTQQTSNSPGSAPNGKAPQVPRPVLTGLSGNELYCLKLKGLFPGEMVLGNSVYSVSSLGEIGAGNKAPLGSEIKSVTAVLREGRQVSYERMLHEAQERGGIGIAGVASRIKHVKGNLEFLSQASLVRSKAEKEQVSFSLSGSGQDYYCFMDAGYQPLKFVFGNVAYSSGTASGVLSGLKNANRGEVPEYSTVFKATRQLALDRILKDAQSVGANSVLGIETHLISFQSASEMLMLGTAAYHPALPGEFDKTPATSNLSSDEIWNLTSLGFVPVKLVLGTAVYSLGMMDGIKAMLKALAKGETSYLTALFNEARDRAFEMARKEAEAAGADQVVGLRAFIREAGSLVEFIATGTAIKALPGLPAPQSPLPAQALSRDRESWIEDSSLFSENAERTGI